MEQEPDINIIDADSLLYRICWKEKSPALAKKQMEAKINKIISDVGAPENYVFVKGTGNFRFEIAIDYKGHRTSVIEEDMRERIENLYEFCREEYVPCDNAEADDFCSIYHHKATAEGKLAVVSHIDKDLNMIPGWHFNFVTDKMYHVIPEDAHTFLMTQLLTGDPADNIKGIKGIGPVTAMKKLSGLTNEEMLPMVLATWEDKGGDTWEADFLKAANLLFIRHTESLLRPMTKEEIMDVLTWEGDGPRFFNVRSDMVALNCDEQKWHTP